MLGIPPFFRTFGPQQTIEDHLADSQEALEGFRHVLRRSHRAARFAISFAVHRLDHDGALIQAAARGDAVQVLRCEQHFKRPADLQECLLPNRRVEVLIEARRP